MIYYQQEVIYHSMKWKEIADRKYYAKSNRARLHYENERDIIYKDEYIKQQIEYQELYEFELIIDLGETNE